MQLPNFTSDLYEDSIINNNALSGFDQLFLPFFA